MTGGGIVHDAHPSGATSAGLQESLEAEESTDMRPSGGDQGDLVITYEDFLGFLVEVQQAGIFYIKNADPAQLSQIVGIACPTTLFPYVRESVDSLVVKGGFPPLQLAQVNFEALYVKALQEQQQKNQDEGTDLTTH